MSVLGLACVFDVKMETQCSSADITPKINHS